jgi:hypothetical protein
MIDEKRGKTEDQGRPTHQTVQRTCEWYSATIRKLRSWLLYLLVTVVLSVVTLEWLLPRIGNSLGRWLLKPVAIVLGVSSLAVVFVVLQLIVFVIGRRSALRPPG